MSSLGQPAKIRILPDRKAQPRTTLAWDEYVAPSNVSPEDLLRTVAAEGEALDPRTVDNNIEELRRYFLLGVGGIIQAPTLARCQEVAQELDHGFTKKQLRRYLEQQSPIADVVGTKDYDCLEARYHSRVCTRSAWFSGVSTFPEEALLRLDPGVGVRRRHAFITGLPPPAGKERQTEKQVLIERILRQAWKVRCKEEKAMEGELDIRLQTEHLKLLLNHKTNMFTRLAEQYEAKIDISQSRHIVRLTGDYATCSDLSKLIYYMIERVQSAELELPTSLQVPEQDEEQDSSRVKNWYKEKNPLRYKDSPIAIARTILNDRAYIKHIEKITNTLIETVDSTRGNYVSKLRVYYFGPETTDFEDVQRLVFQLLQPDTVDKTQIQCDPPVKLMIPIHTPIEVGSAVPWTERGIQWIRWRDGELAESLGGEKSISNRRRSFLTTYDPVSSRGVAKATGRFLSEGRPRYANVSVRQRQPIYWQINQEHKVSAVLGQIIYPALQPRAETKLIQARTYARGSQHVKLEKAFLKTIDSRRIMTTILPEVLPSLEDFPFSGEDVRHELRVRLRPSLVQDGPDMSLKSLPEIDLRIGLGKRDEPVQIRSVQLVRDKCESDLLLPQEVADIRFCGYTVSEPTVEIDPKITRFVEESNFNVWGEERLQTPSKLSLRIPKWAIQQDAAEDLTRTIGVEYAYDSMEYRSYMSLMYRGVRLYYTTIEAGKAGGRRTELRFEASLEGPSRVKSEFIPFFDTVREFVARMNRPKDIGVELEDTDS
ncbi:hypothetical protein MMC30_005804 [Trapelia coarctata]|nr:hypothetical protein [Trapelia coarctata]